MQSLHRKMDECPHLTLESLYKRHPDVTTTVSQCMQATDREQLQSIVGVYNSQCSKYGVNDYILRQQAAAARALLAANMSLMDRVKVVQLMGRECVRR
jgi:hypothetical protein